MHHTQIERTMTLSLEGSADDVFPLFGPLREREWDPEWDPSFIAPDDGQSCATGTVFSTADPDRVWVMTVYDPARRSVRYVMVQASVVTFEIAVDVSPAGPGASTADVMYRRTALSPEGETALEEFSRSWPSWAQQWEQAINALLARRRI